MVESREGVDAISCALIGWATLSSPCAVLVNVERWQGKCDTTRGVLLDQKKKVLLGGRLSSFLT